MCKKRVPFCRRRGSKLAGLLDHLRVSPFPGAGTPNPSVDLLSPDSQNSEEPSTKKNSSGDSDTTTEGTPPPVSGPPTSSRRRKPAAPTKVDASQVGMFPLRVIVETVRDHECTKCVDTGGTVADSYAIVSGQTLLSQLVDTVLAALGLQQIAYGARGMIQMKNWKPLRFEQITEDVEATVESVLKDISNNLTLKILAKQAESAAADCVGDMKERLLKAALNRNPQILATIKNIQLKDFVNNLLDGSTKSTTVTAEQIEGFNNWIEDIQKGRGLTNTSGSTQGGQSSASSVTVSSTNTNSNGGGPIHTTETPRFHPLMEVPKLQRWFQENPSPSRQKLLQYMHLLNNGSYRRHNSKVTYQQVCNWFSNSRAVQRNHEEALLAAHSTSNLWPDLNSTLAALANAGSVPAIEHSVSSLSKVLAGVAGAASEPQSAASTLDFNEFLRKSILENGMQAAAKASGNQSLLNNAAFDLNRSAQTGTTSSTPMDQDGSPQESETGFKQEPLKVEAGSDFTNPSPDSRPLIISDSSAVERTRNSESLTIEGNPSPMSQFSPDSQTENLFRGSPQIDPQRRPGGTSFHPGIYGTSAGSAVGTSTISRSRLMFDPLTELPLLEKWFEENPHPSWIQIDQFTEGLNSMAYRQTYPPVSTHNVKIWFKNRRAKCKRLLGTPKNESGSQ